MRAVDRRSEKSAPTPTGSHPLAADRRGRVRRRGRLPLLGAAVASLALMAFAPGALASTLTFANGTLTYQASNGSHTNVDFGQNVATPSSVEVRTYDTDPITGAVPANCTSTPPTTSSGATAPSSDYTCTGVTAVVANAGNTAAYITGQGDQYNGGVTPTITPLRVPITENGSPQADDLIGGNNNDTINGNGGDDQLDGGPGSDTINGGSGNVTIYGDNETQNNTASPTGDNDTINAGTGDDTIYPSNGTNHITGGGGVDQVVYYDNAYVPATSGSGPGSYVATPVTVDLTGKADSGYAGNNTTITGVQDATVQDSNYETCAQAIANNDATACAYGNATITGGSQPGMLTGGSGNDTINAGSGGDFINGGLGNNTINAVNGYPDRVDCGGAGTANVDQFDSVYHCTTINRTTVANEGLAAQDPGVSFTAPAENAKLSYGRATTLSVTVTPSTHPIAQVVFYVGQRAVCTVKTAPYQCTYTPAKQDIGHVTLIAVAQDSSGLTGTTTRAVVVNPYNGALQLKSRRLTVRRGKVSATFKCSSSLPCVFRFTIVIHGRLARSHKTATIVFTKSTTGIKTIRAGRTVTETAGVTKGALTVLEHARGHSLKGKLSTRPRTPQQGIISIVTLSLKR